MRTTREKKKERREGGEMKNELKLLFQQVNDTHLEAFNFRQQEIKASEPMGEYQ